MVAASPGFTTCFGCLKLTVLGSGASTFLQPLAPAAAEVELESSESPPPREISTAATPTAITAKTARMIQRRSGPCCSTARHPNTQRSRCGFYDREMPSSPLLTPLAAAVLHVGDPERILELGCGDGEGTLFLAREFPSARVRGIDRSAEAIRAATARIGLDPEGRIAFKQSGSRSFPFPDDQFDLLAALDAHPPAREAARVLRPGGFLALASSRDRQVLSGFRGGLRRRLLARLGFESIWSEEAGDGSFSVQRLRGGGAPGLA